MSVEYFIIDSYIEYAIKRLLIDHCPI